MFRKKILPKLFICIGICLIMAVIIPTLGSWVYTQVRTTPELIDPTAVSPVRLPYFVNSLGIGSQISFLEANSWFDASPVSQKFESNVTYFTLTIPRLNMVDIPVEVNGGDLKKNAIHFSGTSLPGSLGNAVIFGHSALPQFYKAGNPLTVFNPLLQIKKSDEVVINFDGITYRYKINSIKEVKPSDIEVLAQRFDRREITLITCTPLGTYWNRFVARGEIISDKNI